VALPDYFARNAVALAQAISGLDEARLTQILEPVRVGITIGAGADNAEGRALTDLLVRLLARLYPTLIVRSERGDAAAADAQLLARNINPKIDLLGKPTVEIVVGTTRLARSAPVQIKAGSDAWIAALSTTNTQSCGNSDSPFGAGVAACLAAANLFRHVFLPQSGLDTDVTFKLLDLDAISPSKRYRAGSDEMVLAGAGAIGNATCWALARSAISGELAVVDPEKLDLGNLQRYVLAEHSDVDALKTDIVARYFGGRLQIKSFDTDIATYISSRTRPISSLLLALDSARDRRLAQACLPAWIANAWTQAGDLGLSTHDFLNGACVRCLYLPDKALASEDAIIAEAFGIPEKLMEVRMLLYRGEGVPRALLQAIADARNLPLERLLPFEGRPVRNLYREGFCGGAVIPLNEIGTPPSEVHVPLAHQSALAGVLLGAAAFRQSRYPRAGTEITQIDLMKPFPPSPTRPAAKDPRGICLCQDDDYREAYGTKFPPEPAESADAPKAKVARKRKRPRPISPNSSKIRGRLARSRRIPPRTG
jgi:molybdopterin/thiamine biosynthesis adenylyltransferase